MIGKMKCLCGHASCKDWWLTGIGGFVQGSGFSEEEADRIIAALNADEACVWTLDDDESETWQSACGELWQFTTGGPEDNGVRFCHGCGKPASFAQSGAGSSSTSSDLAAEGVSE